MLPQKKRVQRPLFPIVVKKGKTYSSTHISMRVLFAPAFAIENKYTFVVSKKSVLRAHTRNLLKRRGYTVIRKMLPELKKGFICIFYIKKGSATLSYLQFESEIRELLQRARVI